MILASPFSSPDHSLISSWAASELIGGTPGRDNQSLLTSADWAEVNGVIDSSADNDGDSVTNLQEFVLLSSRLASNPSLLDPTKVVNNRLVQEITCNLKTGEFLL